VLAVNLLFGMQSTGAAYSKNRVSPSVRQAYEWVKSHTQTEEKFLILTGCLGVLDDPTNEWFPALAERQSITTAQGTEWLGGNLFVHNLTIILNIQQCKTDLNPLKCAEAMAYKVNRDYDYIFVTLPEQQGKNNVDLGVEEYSGFQVVFSSNEVVILKKSSLATFQ
jgi:hypothetical protein